MHVLTFGLSARAYRPLKCSPRLRIRARCLCSAARPATAVQVLVPPPRVASARRFVVVSDLHVKSDTLHTALQALRATHRAAAARDAGVLFCGDFWHARGAIPVHLLHHVLRELETWTQPVVMFPGNHDMVNRSGDEQSLTPLATTLGAENCVLVTKPAVFMNALFVPYLARVDAFVDALHGAAALPEPPSTVFCHAEIAGASIAHSLTSPVTADVEVVHPQHFLESGAWRNVYSGHLHCPHTIPGTNITYIGSPYQVTANECGQDKRLLVLDAGNRWDVLEALSLDLGRRFFRIDLAGREIDTLELPQYRAGDAITIKTTPEMVHADSIRNLVSDLRVSGVRTYVYQTVYQRPINGSASPESVALPFAAKPRLDSGTLSSLSPVSLFRDKYVNVKGLSDEAVDLGVEILTEHADSNTLFSKAGNPCPGSSLSINWLSCSLQAFGCFLDPLKYSFSKRGIVLITGRDEGTESNSNGSGKSTLCLAALWSVTGCIGTSPTAAVVHDDASFATVSTAIGLSGDTIDSFAHQQGLPAMAKGKRRIMHVKRTSTRRQGNSYKQSLEISIDGTDVTCLDIRLTQRRLDELLETSLLPHTTFLTENSTSILDASDRDLKKYLGLLFPLDLWVDARARAREKMNVYEKEATRASTMVLSSASLIDRLTKSARQLRTKADVYEAEKQRRIEQADEDARANLTALEAKRRKICEAAEPTGTNLSESSRSDIVGRLEQSLGSVETHSRLLRRLDELYSSTKKRLEDRREREQALLTDMSLCQKRLFGAEALEGFRERLHTAEEEISQFDTWIESRSSDFVEDAGAKQGALLHERDEGNYFVAAKDLEDRVQFLRDELVAVQAHHGDIMARLQESENADEAVVVVCDRCLRPFDGEAHLDARQKLLDEAEAALNRATELKQKWREAIREYQVKTDEIRSERQRRLASSMELRRASLRERDILKAKLEMQSGLEEKIAFLASQLERVRGESNHYQNEIDELCCANGVQNALDLRESLKEKITAGSQAIHKLEQALSEWDAEEARVLRAEEGRALLRADAANLETTYTESKIRLEALKDEINPHAEAVAALEAELESTSAIVAQAQSDAMKWERKHEAARALDLAFGPRGVQSLILEASIERLQDQTNRYLDALAAGDLIARFQAYSEYKTTSGRRRAEGDVIEAISRQVYAKRKDGQLSVRGIQQLSRGQHRRVELACTLAFADLCRERGHSSSLLVMDEALRFLDSDGRRRLAKLLPRLPHETVLVVSHGDAPEVLGVASGGVDVCVRNNDCSTVQVQAEDETWMSIGDDGD